MLIDFHRHCQATILSANGTDEQNGLSWKYIHRLKYSLDNLPKNWIQEFELNRDNITQDFASVLKILNSTVDNYLPLSGGTMGGFLTLHSNPTLDMHAATKRYVDYVVEQNSGSGSGDGTITGITMNGVLKGTEGEVDLGNVVSSIKVNGDVKTPNSNGLVDIGTFSSPSFSVTNTDNSGTTISRINYNGNQYDIKMPPIGDSGSGSVIDGTVLHEETITNNIIVSTGTKYNLYTVKNDCLLYIKNISGLIHHYYILGNEIQYKSANDAVSLLVPVKANTVIQIDESINASTYPFTFIEYKLNSLNPQLAFPDWDESKSKTINNGDTITENGWIIIERGDSSWGKCSINGITVFDTLGVTTNANNGCATVPVSRGDVITFSGGNTAPTVTFYPAKMHEICTACQCYWQ